MFDYITDLTLSQYRIAINVICSIAYNSSYNSLDLSDSHELKEQIDMMVTKQVNSSIPK